MRADSESLYCLQPLCKVGVPVKRSLDIGADYIATGHYARVEQLPNGRYSLKKSATAAKDQTYALYNLTQEQLSHTLMPVGEYTKDQIRQIAEEEGLFTVREVMDGASEKMIRRHPHVFGKSMLSEQGEPVTDWDAIKKQEKAGKEWTEAYLPGALEEAEKLLERAEERKGIKK